jgi:hypothetical protein
MRWLDCCQIARNVATNSSYDYGFKENALPVNVEKAVGIFATRRTPVTASSTST